MVAIKQMSVIAQKFVTRAQAAQSDYQQGIAGTPPGVWEAATTAASDSFAAGVTAAVARGAFAKGVAGQGAKWARKATSLGPTRYAAGVAAAGQDYTTGFQKYHDILAGLSLGPKGPRGAPGNYMRSTSTGTALHTARVGS